MTIERSGCVAIIGLLAAACSPSSAGGGSTPAPPAPGSRAPWCPATVPQQGAACSPGPSMEGVLDTPCEYRTEANPHCTTVAGCYSGTWTVTPADPTCNANPASCPSDFDAGNTDMCSTPRCTYAAGRCDCLTCSSTYSACSRICRTRDSGTEWACAPWPQADCPDPEALLGTACPGVQLQHPCVNVSEQNLSCVNGYWVIPVPFGGC